MRLFSEASNFQLAVVALVVAAQLITLGVMAILYWGKGYGAQCARAEVARVGLSDEHERISGVIHLVCFAALVAAGWKLALAAQAVSLVIELGYIWFVVPVIQQRAIEENWDNIHA